MDDKYDLIILGDVLEHFEKDDALEFLSVCQKKSNYILLNLPIGDNWKQGELYGNKYEIHRSWWRVNDFKNNNVISKKIFLDYIGRKYAVLLLSNKNEFFLKKSVTFKLSNFLHRYPGIRSLLSGLKKKLFKY